MVVEVNGYTIRPRANLKGATADKTTLWPDGFDPVAAGAIFED